MKLTEKFIIKNIIGRKSRSEAFKRLNVGDTFEITFDVYRTGYNCCGRSPLIRITGPDGIARPMYVNNLQRVLEGEGPIETWPNGVRYGTPEFVKAKAILNVKYAERLKAWEEQGPRYVLEKL